MHPFLLLLVVVVDLLPLRRNTSLPIIWRGLLFALPEAGVGGQELDGVLLREKLLRLCPFAGVRRPRHLRHGVSRPYFSRRHQLPRRHHRVWPDLRVGLDERALREKV